MLEPPGICDGGFTGAARARSVLLVLTKMVAGCEVSIKKTAMLPESPAIINAGEGVL